MPTIRCARLWSTASDIPSPTCSRRAQTPAPGVVTDTSFNQEYEAIVNSPMDALRTFAVDLDFLLLEDTLLSKP